jgi:hypothetical protein
MDNMKESSLVGVVLGVLILWSACAAAQPASIPQIGQAPHDAAETFRRVRHYFSEPSLSGLFKLVSADEASHTIVAKRGGIDTQTWSEWAYCKLGPEHLLDTLQESSATVKVKVEPSDRQSSYVTVRGYFEATYGLGASSSTTQCVSKGVLEKNVLSAAGATASGE